MALVFLCASGVGTLAHASESSLEATAPFLGVVIPHDSVDLSSKFESRLERLEVDVGDTVRQGEVVARLDIHPVVQELAAARASLQSSRAEEQASGLALAEAREKKSRHFTPRSLELGVYSKEELATLRYQERTALARLEASRARTREQQARVAELERNVNEAALVAPFDGIVATRPVSPGARVAAGQPILRLLGTGGWKVRFAVPEEEARQLEPGSPLELSLQQRQQTLAGHVESIAPEVDAAARMVFAIAAFDAHPPETVSTGMVVHVQPGPRQGAIGQRESSDPIPTRSGR
ncbi:efflux RND transporter periplasmic adaptor subunit [Hyalangium rubrum]|uniref:Efflux RND transporter periplasmic adaptor subunit n=1 Tax=Hyalangium rubrum TaxID=3103134 RepID=A0ABU5H4C3_9BACT|nr:efflux RND transporter periplasmic adaptor subunit [Hyalangium sp. s54d21]MDY7228091.1 efflux RND transporter periplasmic adaptor subunit [Hyalangium sp. s54d21]